MIKRLQVVFKGMAPSPALTADIEERIEQLERAAPTLRSCRVVIDAPHRHHARGRTFRVVIDVTLPGGALVVDGNGGDGRAHEDPYIAVRDAFVAVRRRLRDVVEQGRERARSARA